MNKIESWLETDEEIYQLAKKLAEKGLGIFYPHEHKESGEITALDNNKVILERDLQVDFKQKDCPDFRNAIPVGWMWRNGRLEAVAGCCNPDPTDIP